MRQVRNTKVLTTLELTSLKIVTGYLIVRARPLALARLIAPAQPRASRRDLLLSWRVATRASG